MAGHFYAEVIAATEIGMRSFEGETYGSLDAFKQVERPVPEPAPDKVRLRIEATALGFVDGLLIHGRYQYKPPLPYVPGGEIAGVVDAVGADVRHVGAGDRPVTWQFGSGLSEYTVVTADKVQPIPVALRLHACRRDAGGLPDRPLRAV